MRLIDPIKLKEAITVSEILQNRQHVFDIIDEQPTVPQWIPVTERLPESGRYLASCSLSVFSPQVLNYDKDNGEWFYDGCKSMDFEMPSIEAWMPLPESYRGDNNDQ